jgi:hypothetical protein
MRSVVGRTWTSVVMIAFSAGVAVMAQKQWPVHDMERPVPAAVETGTMSAPAPRPSDAIALFDGKDLSLWQAVKGGGPAKWKVENGYFEVVKGTGDIATTRGFGGCQLHVEWMAPAPAVGEGQDRGNSGVFFMGMYEVQVLDSYKSRTYADGQAAALYGQHPPLVNASRAPGEWQSYDIIFHAPRFEGDKVLQPARVTVLHNGVLVQDSSEMTGPSGHKSRPPYKPHADALPIRLQDHAHPVRFRNIWIRELKAGSGS